MHPLLHCAADHLSQRHSQLCKLCILHTVTITLALALICRRVNAAWGGSLCCSGHLLLQLSQCVKFTQLSRHFSHHQTIAHMQVHTSASIKAYDQEDRTNVPDH